MSKTVRILVVLFAGALAAACSHGRIANDFEFDADKGYSLISYDIYFIADTWPNYAIYLFPYDEQTGTINPKKRIKSGSGFVSLRKNEGVKFYLGEMTFTLDHPPGVTKQPLDVIAHDKAHVLGRMAKYPGVQAPVVVAPQTFVSFDPGEPKREGACIEGYTD